MTIEEKAKDFAGFNFPHSRDLITTAKMNEKSNSFKAGAEWMIIRATEWLVKQGLKTHDGVVTICVEDFIKAMEE